MEDFNFTTETREVGRAASRRLRARGMLPMNLYGHRQENRNIAVEQKAFEKFIDAGHRLLTLDLGGNQEYGVVTEIQYDSLGASMIHVDVTRVDRTETIEMAVPVETYGVSKGQSAGGTLDIAIKSVHIEGPATSIPEKIEVAIAALELGASVRVKDLALPQGCKVVHHEPEDVVLAVHHPRGAEEEAPAEEGPAEPEVITRKKEDEED